MDSRTQIPSEKPGSGTNAGKSDRHAEKDGRDRHVPKAGAEGDGDDE